MAFNLKDILQQSKKYSGVGSTTASGLYGQVAGGSAPAAAAVPAAAPSPSASAKPIDYLALINGDPLLGQERADLSAQGVSDAASRAAAIQRALIQFGIVPDFASSAQKLGLSGEALGYLNQDVNDRTRQLAQANTQEGLSLTARLAKAHTDAVRNIRNQLAARGIIRSGETPYQLGEEANQYKISTNDATQQLLDYLTGAIGAFTQSERQRRQQLAQYLSDAASRQLGLLGDTSAGAGGGGAPAPAAPAAGGPAPKPNVVGQNAGGAQLVERGDGTYYFKYPDGSTSRLFG